jgi:centromeric protein E
MQPTPAHLAPTLPLPLLTHARTPTLLPTPPTADLVFGESSTTRELFEAAVKGHVDSVVDGYNGTVFAYGQTAAGKTHTMLGSKSNPGVLPLAVNEIMEAISRARHRAFLIRCSYIEIYKEQITDLIGRKSLDVHESKAKVRGLRQ